MSIIENAGRSVVRGLAADQAQRLGSRDRRVGVRTEVRGGSQNRGSGRTDPKPGQGRREPARSRPAGPRAGKDSRLHSLSPLVRHCRRYLAIRQDESDGLGGRRSSGRPAGVHADAPLFRIVDISRALVSGKGDPVRPARPRGRALPDPWAPRNSICPRDLKQLNITHSSCPTWRSREETRPCSFKGGCKICRRVCVSLTRRSRTTLNECWRPRTASLPMVWR